MNRGVFSVSLPAVFMGLLFGMAIGARAAIPTPVDLHAAASRYAHGDGVDQDSHRASELYCVAVLQGFERAALDLGRLHLDGQGVAANPAVAAGWFERARRGGHTAAGEALEKLDGLRPQADASCPLPVRGVEPDRALIEQWVRLIAPEYGVSSRLVLTVMYVESNFDPRALSHRNARGLMQLLPETARRFGVEDEWDPPQNIRGGVSYLRWLIERYDGRLTRVLAAYNAGEHAVDEYDGVPPYQETKNYVRRILARYGRYRHPVKPIPISETGVLKAISADDALAMTPPRSAD